MSFELPYGVQDELFNSTTGEAVFSCPANDTNPGDCTLKPKYADGKIVIQLITASAEPGAEFEFQKTVSLNDLYSRFSGALSCRWTSR